MGDWKIGNDKRRRSTDQLRNLRRANDGQVRWDTEAPADFTYLYHPDRVLVRAILRLRNVRLPQQQQFLRCGDHIQGVLDRRRRGRAV